MSNFTAVPSLSTRYSPGYAENGHYVPLQVQDNDYSAQEPNGKFASLTYVVNKQVGGTNVAGFNIPAHTSVAYTYYGSTNNVETASFRNNGLLVATLEFEYVGDGVSDDDRVSLINFVEVPFGTLYDENGDPLLNEDGGFLIGL